MDRRQKKTREAIFKAFTELLSKKHYNSITVGEIIERANVGRATFYAHFETKDFLLKALCEELFCHIFDSADESREKHRHIFECDAPPSVMLHLFFHLQKNDNNILKLLSCQNNELFWKYFGKNIEKLIESQLYLFKEHQPPEIPENFWKYHISSTLVHTIRWWIDNRMKESPEAVTKYFLMSV